MRGLVAASLLAVVAAGCGTAAAPTPGPTASATPSSLAAGFVRIEHGPRENAQIVVTLPSGRHIYIDVMATSGAVGSGAIPVPGPQDVLVTTVDDAHVSNSPGDLHADMSFVRSFPGRRLTFEAGTIELSDAVIASIPARRTDDAAMGTNHIVIVEAEGLRIVHFGDLGQTAFTPEQLAAIGRPDVAISQLWNPKCAMDEGNGLGIAQMNAVRPRLFVPSHLDFATLRQAVEAWPSRFHKGPLVISRATLPAQTTMLLLGSDADVDGAALDISSAY